MAHLLQTVFFKSDGVWVGYVKNLPGALTQADSLSEARDNLDEAIFMILEANRELNYLTC